MLQQKNVRLDETQVCEAAELRRKLQSELELLMAYQVRSPSWQLCIGDSLVISHALPGS